MRAYISATYKDLRECRDAVRKALDQMEFPYRTMEAYTAEGGAPLERCLADVEGCDVYIGIFAWHYGHRPAGGTKSITQLEYEHAVRTGKVCLIFLLDEEALWPVKFVDRGADAESVDELRAHLTATHMCDFFDSADRLALCVVSAVSRVTESAADQQAGLGPEGTRQYFERLRQQYGGVDLDAFSPRQPESVAGVRLSEVFVEPYVRENQPPELPHELRQMIEEKRLDESQLPDDVDPGDLAAFYTAYQSKPVQPVLDVLCNPDLQRIVLLGEPGSGKSAVVRYLLMALTEKDADTRLAPLANHLPIMIEMRSYGAFEGAPRKTFFDYLSSRADIDGYLDEPDVLRNHLAGGEPAVVIFDGLDEIFDVRARENASAQIAAFAEAFPRTRVIVSSRLAEYSKRTLAAAGFAHYTLQDFNAGRTADFLDRWFRAALADRPDAVAMTRRDIVLGAIRESPALTELAGNPMLLSILAVIGQQRLLPKRRWQLYKHAAVTLIERWDNSRTLSRRKEVSFVDADEKRELLRRLAFEIQFGRTGSSGGYVSGEQLKWIFTDYLCEHFGLDMAEGSAAAALLIEELRERSFILGRYGPADYGFVHRTFLEFFCAWAIVDKIQYAQTWSFEDLTDLYGKRWTDPAWWETLRLVAGQLNAGQTAKLVEFLLLEADPAWRAYGEEAEPGAVPGTDPPWNVALAAHCLAGIRPLNHAGNAPDLVLRHVIRLLEHCAANPTPEVESLLADEVIPAVESVGALWPRREVYLRWYREQGVALPSNPAASYAARLAAMLAAPADRLDQVFIGHLGDEQIRIACAAVSGLGEMIRQSTRREPPTDARHVRSRLIETARHDDRAVVRLAAVQTLGVAAATAPDVRETLFEAIQDGYYEVRLTAVRALGERYRGDLEVAATLLAVQRDDPSSRVRVAAMRVLTQDRQLRPDLVAALLHACRGDSDADVVDLAARVLQSRPEAAEEARNVLLERLRDDKSAGVRRAAARNLGRSGHEEELLDRIRRDPEPAVIREAALALSGRRDASRIAVCSELIARFRAETHDEVIRRALVRTLDEACPDDRRTDELLAEAAKADPEPPVRLAALRAFASRPVSERRRAVCIEVAQAGDSAAVRRAAVEALAEDRGAAATAALAGLATVDDDLGVRLAAVRGLAGRRLTVDLAMRLAELTDGRHHAQIRLAVLEVLHRNRPAGLDLTELFHDRAANDPVGEVFAAAAAAAIAWPGGAAALWPVIAARAADDRNPRVRTAAVELLGSAAGFSGAPEILHDRLRRDPDPSVVDAAARAVASLTNEGARDILISRLTEPDTTMRCIVIRSLAAWLPDDTAVRRALLEQARAAAQAEVRCAAVTALRAAAHLDEVSAAYRECLDDPEYSVRDTVTRLLSELNR